ncbi:MAG: D-alanyl-D-alanine carboxypeptidase/D-alanyl-D-alanine-endopeptidase [Betaproteobacteria bacterium]|nr:D-alanyl-D-alanine carboxypeptidase/D-alanyl-D-alanine-endopeptidase [Betaproteobacteria bacterium]
MKPIFRFRPHWLFLLLLLPGAFLPARAELPPPVAAALAADRIPEERMAIWVQAVDSPSPLITHQAQKPMLTASVMKLVTTSAALEILGPAHSWKTGVFVDRPPKNGHLEGNLYLRGGGDPELTLERVWLLLRELRLAGIESIDGDLVLDQSDYRLPAEDPAAFDNEPLRPYNLAPEALMLNWNTLSLRLRPEAGRIELLQLTPLAGLAVINKIAPAPGACGDWRERLHIEVRDESKEEPGGAVEVSGVYAPSCGEKALDIVPWTSERYAERLFRALWSELGGRFSGYVRTAPTPPAAQALLSFESPPLAAVIRDINKWSNNVMARQLFLALSPTQPATLEASRARMKTWLAGKGISGIELDNGSGLSRAERATAEALGRLLLAMWKSPLQPELAASLPLAGIDGTLRKRFGAETAGADAPGDAAAGNAHLKTGYIAGARAIAGYVQDRAGRRWAVVGLINSSQLKSPAPLDALIRWVAEQR